MQVLVSDPRQDAILQEFVDQGKWKTALDHCEKRLKKLKKGEDQRLQLNHLAIDLRQQQASGLLSTDEMVKIVSKHHAFIEFLEKCDDYEIVDHLEGIFGNFDGEIWKRAAKSQQQDEKFYQDWFENKFAAKQFSLAAEACMFWRLRFPAKVSELTIKMALCYFLAYQSSESRPGTTTQANQNGDRCKLMAIRLLQQAAKNTPSDNSKDASLVKNADLEFLINIFRKTGLQEEALTILNDDKKGLRSSLGSWDLARTRISLLISLKRFDEVFQFCKEILLDVQDIYQSSKEASRWGFGEAGDDILVFEVMVLVCQSSEAPSYKLEALQIFNDIAKLSSYNADLATVKLQYCCGSDEENLQAAKNFYTLYQLKERATEVLQYLKPSKRDEFVAFTRLCSYEEGVKAKDGERKVWRKSVTSKINSLATTFDKLSRESASSPKSQRPIDSSTNANLDALIGDCVWTYLSALSTEPEKPAAENGVADGALVLAAKALIAKRSKTATHQARLVLEFLVANSRYNYEALVLLIRICIMQGAVTKAWALYKRLDVKNIQQLKEAAMFFQGISSLHPHSNPRYGLDPLQSLEKMLKWAYSRKAVARSQSLACIEKENWNGALEAVNIVAQWESTAGYIMIASEITRISLRSRPDQVSAGVSHLEPIIASLVELDASRTKFQNLPRLPEMLVSLREEMKLLQLDDYLDVGKQFRESAVLAYMQGIVRESLGEEELKSAHDVLNHSASQLESSPKLALILMGKGLNDGSNGRWNSTEAESLLEAVKKGLSQLEKMVDGSLTQHPDFLSRDLYAAKTLERLYGWLDSLDILSETVQWLHRRQKISKDWLEEVLKLVSAQRERLVDWPHVAIDRMKQKVEQYTEEVTSDWTGKQVEVLVGRERIKTMMQQYINSVADTLQGIQ